MSTKKRVVRALNFLDSEFNVFFEEASSQPKYEIIKNIISELALLDSTFNNRYVLIEEPLFSFMLSQLADEVAKEMPHIKYINLDIAEVSRTLDYLSYSNIVINVQTKELVPGRLGQWTYEEFADTLLIELPVVESDYDLFYNEIESIFLDK